MIYDDIKYEYRIILVGESGVDKTSMIIFFLEKDFSRWNTFNIM